MIALYRPGTSLLHRAPAGVKGAILAATAVLVSATPLDGTGVAVLLSIVVALYLVAGLPTALRTEAWRLRWIVLMLGGALALFVSPTAAWVGTGRVVALLLLAALLTATTRHAEILGVLTRLLRPFRRWGVEADTVAMTISLTLTMVPVVAGFAAGIRHAAQARGVRVGVRLFLPLLVRTLRHADDVGDALAARGIA